MRARKIYSAFLAIFQKVRFDLGLLLNSASYTLAVSGDLGNKSLPSPLELYINQRYHHPVKSRMKTKIYQNL